ncbi:Alcohol dehydrogenase GroES-like domain protein [Acididesulfobacillus acetoxydans]|uniref:Alcohol dehydrogenase GroES-like domain protein n=1 Tax=Acididesulfobacillus acetoxydans TaxID=1561005 RepID=A0A8S0Y2J5_9FIRM|nr:zinc-dependent dehydrogenase [Acididesulfobacillus acetoxydans]CAA7600895.1 Alcohol dehydrogenase GroES-like domain protein [Acididesulfobacillus acetoxydans]CEJ08301.1 Sorbitol dehydrogenase [Acididesulfobacillus acetoxydans]
MKAALLEGIKHLALRDIPDPVCEPDGLLLQVAACGVCGSDVRNYLYSANTGVSQRLKGHEVSGRVVAVGSKTTGFAIGERLSIAPPISCGQCYYCQRGLQHLCDHYQEIAREYPGGFAELMAIPAVALQYGCVCKITDQLSFTEATVSEPLSSVIACQEAVNVGLGDNVVIFGAGPIGILHAQLARIHGAGQVIVIEQRPERLGQALKLGATMALNGLQDDLRPAVLNATENRGADVVIVAAPSSMAQAQAIRLARKRGRVVWFGGLPKGSETKVDANDIHYREVTIYGAFSYSPRHNRMAVDLISRRKIDASKLITATFPLGQVEKAFEHAAEGKGLKTVIVMN